ncbi:hypothetical protein [Porticoccus hydrocarbonoclasticus]|uniref:hypothetical protein n=1 Tax=Porticoccus hydrocarbonoclasticus TaxID=1073414 RepID=UPI000569B17C|nr:hypothetical protein [Porticoccus hydrocarbonoclasticus]
MINHIDPGEDQLDIILPSYSRGLCEKALELARKNLENCSKEDFFKYTNAFITLLASDIPTETVNSDQIREMVSKVQPMSQLFRDQKNTEEYLQTVDALLPQNHPLQTLALDLEDNEAPKAVFASAIFSLIIALSAQEKMLTKKATPVEERLKVLDAISENIRLMYEQLLYFDSELEVIQNRQEKRTAAAKAHSKHTDLHNQFFSFHKKNKDQWSKRESARRFYSSLTDQEKRLYTSSDHAVRQLTDALRRHLRG